MSKFTRREFMRRTAIAGAGVALLPRIGWTFSQSPPGIWKFKTGLPGLGPAGANELGNYIEALVPDTTTFKDTDYYQIVAKQFTQTIYNYRGVTLSPNFWGYRDKNSDKGTYLGGVIVAQRNRPVLLKIANQLPATHVLPVDPTAMDPSIAGDGRPDRIAVHLHGGLVRWDYDGGPFHWFSNPDNPGGWQTGASFMNGTGIPGEAVYSYPNNQSARLVWYHDHAYGVTRLNAYAGVASGYLITDSAEAALIQSDILPNPLGGLYTYGIPLVIQDKGFLNTATDPNYPVGGAKGGDLWYPHIYEGADASQLPSMTLSDPNLCNSGTARWDNGGGTDAGFNPVPPISLIPEAFFDTILVNGAPYPTISLPPARFRFRILNGSQARFYNLQAFVKDRSPDGITLAPLPSGQVDSSGNPIPQFDINSNPILVPKNAPGPAFIQVGNEGGFLPAPVVFNTGGNANLNSNLPMGWDLRVTLPDGTPNPTFGNANRFNLLLAPAERADIIVDFRNFAGKTLVLYSDAPAPFPGGDIRNDYYPGAPDLRCIGGANTPTPGQGPDTRILMQFVISAGPAPRVNPTFPAALKSLQAALPITFNATQPPPLGPDGLQPQVKTLDEDFDEFGRLRQRLGAPAASDYLSMPTEVAKMRSSRPTTIVSSSPPNKPISSP